LIPAFKHIRKRCKRAINSHYLIAKEDLFTPNSFICLGINKNQYNTIPVNSKLNKKEKAGGEFRKKIDARFLFVADKFVVWDISHKYPG